MGSLKEIGIEDKSKPSAPKKLVCVLLSNPDMSIATNPLNRVRASEVFVGLAAFDLCWPLVFTSLLILKQVPEYD